MCSLRTSIVWPDAISAANSWLGEVIVWPENVIDEPFCAASEVRMPAS
jgi:hypothetical protein